MSLATITLNVDPFIELGPLTVAWHGLMIAAGVIVGGRLALRYGRERGLDAERLLTLIMIIAIAGIVGSRLFYLAENDAAALLQPGDWLGTLGFSFYGAMILGTAAAAVNLRAHGLGIRYLDALAAGFPLGMAVGRIGDVLNGEHYGPASDLPWAIRYLHPDADVPSSAVAYHSGGLYEIVLALAIFALIWPLRRRFQRPGVLLWTVIALYSAGRFAMFFVRSDSDGVAVGLNSAQWTSVALIVIAAGGLWLVKRRPPAEKP